MANPQTVGTGQDHATLALWESYMDALLGGDDQIAQVTGLTEDNGTIFFDGITGSAVNICRIESQDGALDGTNSSGANIDSAVTLAEVGDQVLMEIEEIEFHTANTSLNIGFGQTNSEVNVVRCVFRDQANVGVIIIEDNIVRIGACLFRGIDQDNFDTAIKLTESTTTDVKVINTTIYSCEIAMDEVSGTYLEVTNVAALCEDVNGAYEDFRSFANKNNMTTCISSGDGSGNTDTLRDDTAPDNDFTNTALDDFTVVTTGELNGTGTQIVGEAWFPATDLVGTIWQNPPSVGCFELAGAPPVGRPQGPLGHPFIGPLGGPI